MLVFLSSLTLLALSMCFTPGPTNALSVTTGLEAGVRAVLPMSIGSALSANLTLIGLGFGLSEVFVRFPLIYDVLRWVGAGYLLWLAWKIADIRIPERLLASLPGSPAAKARRVRSLAPPVPTALKEGFKPLTFGQGAFLQLVNVKVWMTNLIVISSYVGTADGWQTRLYIAAALFTVTGVCANTTWAAIGLFMRRFLSPNGIRRANYVFSAFLVVSVALLFI